MCNMPSKPRPPEQPVSPDDDTDRLMMGVTPLAPARLKELLDQVSRAQTYGKTVPVPANDVLAMVAEIRLRRRYLARPGKGDPQS